MNILRNMMVRCVENIVNTDAFLKSQIFDIFRYFGVLGTARDLILAAFWTPGAAFWWSAGCWKYVAVFALSGQARLAGWAGPRRGDHVVWVW